jgi:hypothetical protein
LSVLWVAYATEPMHVVKEVRFFVNTKKCQIGGSLS